MREDTANSSDTHTATLDSKASQGYEYGEEVEEKIDIAQGVLIASNDDSLAYELAFGEKEEQREEIEGEDDIPDNVIRIETEDGSGEYIEIEFDENDNLKDINNNDDELNDLLHQAKDILYELSPFSSVQSAYDNLKAGEYKQALFDAITILPQAKTLKAKTIANKAKTIANKIGNIISKDKSKKDVKIAKPKPKSLSRQEVLGIVDKLPRNPKEFRRKLVNSKEELDELWERLTKNAKDLEPKSDKRYGMPIYRRELDDGTVIQYKKASTSRGSVSGGETIEINSQNPRENLRSIHIKK